MEDKQELFVNALISGISDKSFTSLEKLKFIDMLRHLSRASLMVLAEIHKKCIKNVRGPGRNPDTASALPLIDPGKIAEELSMQFDPYLVTSSISEMESQGLFSNTGEWRKNHKGGYKPGSGFDTAMCYTDFAARFVEFITGKEKKNRGLIVLKDNT